MSHLKLFILLGFAIMFAAGLTIGRTFPRVETAISKPSTTEITPTTQSDETPSFPTLDRVLGLTPAQNEQVEKIWKDARGKIDSMSHKFREFDREHDDAVLAILDADQKQEYLDIQHRRDDRERQLRADISQTFKAAEKLTEALLTPEQNKKFEEIRRHGPRHGPPMPGMGPGQRFHRHGRPESMPDSE